MAPRVALVADWLLNRGGAERMILALHEIFPNAPVFTSLYNPEALPEFEKVPVVTSFLQKIPFALTKHSYFLPLMPYAFEQFDLSKYDIVISSCHSASKGIITKPRTLHICYCHSPMRYAWDNAHEYIERYGLPGILKSFAKRKLLDIRLWDRLAADRVDFFATNSDFSKKRIQKYYRRDAEVIYPPIDTKKFQVGQKQRKYYLCVSRLTPYKRIDLAVSVMNELRKPLLIVGKGREMEKLKKMAGPTIQFLGEIEDRELNEIYQEAKALIFPQVEDFGMIPLEAMAGGTPVIAYEEGGALETIIPGETGLFFGEQKEDSLKKIIAEFENKEWDKEKIRKHAERFDTKIFNNRILDFVERKWGIWQKEMV